MKYKHGGKRKGAGRKPKEPTKVMRVPMSIVSDVKFIIDCHKVRPGSLAWVDKS
jgi:hypothetical protein